VEFVTDKQTLNDLNILGKFKQGSLFNMFNRVQTRGGELLLESMFRSPLTATSVINERAAQIRYLQDLGLQWEISRDHSEMALGYLTGDRPASRLSSLLNCYKEKLQEMLYKSDRYAIQQKQIYAVQEILLSASNLLGQLRKKELDVNPCKQIQEKLDKVINAPVLKNLRPKYPYTLSQAAECQYVFRNKCREEIESLLKLLFEFDVFQSVAEVAKSKDLVFAKAVDATADSLLFDVKNLRHPSLPAAVGNDIVMTRRSNMLFLTGANMAGKSTWMKTLGVSYYLAHMGFPVAADQMKFTVMEGIYTSINVPDDISLGWSHFYAEVMRVKTVAKEVSSGKRLFILFDELFKGTNVKDAFDATLAVSKRLAKFKSCSFVISTHIVEVGYELKENSNIQFQYMPTVMEGSKPRYTYQMTEGISTDRQGMIIIENEKILEMLA
jgi:DNA mismatch repair protein MutS